LTTSPSAHQRPPWVYEKKAFVYAPEFNVGCLTEVRVSHDQKEGQGYVSIKSRLCLADMDTNQVIILRICPKLVDMCTVKLTCETGTVSEQVISMLRGVKAASEVSKLRLTLKEPGVVLVPSGLSVIRPAEVGNVSYNAFSRICQAKQIVLYFVKRQFNQDDSFGLRAFASAVRSRSIEAQPLDYTRFNSGQGVRESDWTVFEQPPSDPPAYRPLSPSAKCVLGKRLRGGGRPSASTVSPLYQLPDHHPPPTWSATEVASTDTEIDSREQHNTVHNSTTFARADTLSNSPSPIRPTIFTHEKREEQDALTIQHVLKSLGDIPDNIVREVFKQPRYQRLLQEAALDDPAASSLPVTLTSIEKIVEDRVDRLVTERLADLTKSAFKTHTKQQVHRIVQAQLPLAAELVLKETIGDWQDQFYEDCKANEANLLEIVDDGRLRLRETVDECETEVKESIEGQLSRFGEQVAKVDSEVKEQVAEALYWTGKIESGIYERKGNASQEVIRSRSV
jgi:hypothetical protein